MIARDLLMKALAEMGADGLYNGFMECGCGLDDFEPCGECVLNECEPATRQKDGLFYPMEESTE